MREIVLGVRDKRLGEVLMIKNIEMISPLRQEQGADELLKNRNKLAELGEKRHNKEFIDILWVPIMLRPNHVLLIEATHAFRSQCITWCE